VGARSPAYSARSRVEGVTGWSIVQGHDAASDEDWAAALYNKLEAAVLPPFHTAQAGWRSIMKQAVASIASYFNSHRMMRRYATEAYLR